MSIRPATLASVVLLLAACGSPSGGDVPAAAPPPAADAAAAVEPATAPAPTPAEEAPPEPAAVHEAALAEKGARVTDHGLLVGLDSADFTVGGTAFEPKSDERIEHVVALLGERPELRVEVLGYTDDRGAPEANRRVSERRAEAVRERLVHQEGIDPARIAISCLGAADPIASNETADGRALNRRVELRITDDTGAFASRLGNER